LLLLSKDWTHDLKKLVIKKFQAQVVDRQTAGTCKTPQKILHMFTTIDHTNLKI
jgi:hypothetical protein